MGEPDRIWGSSYWELLKVAQQCGIFGSGVSHGPHNDGTGMILVPATLHEESCVWQSNELKTSRIMAAGAEPAPRQLCRRS